MSKWQAFDVVKRVLAKAMGSARIPASTPALHTVIHELSLKPEYKPFLEEYVFSKQGHFPYSRDLEADLTNLEQSGFLVVPNPELASYECPQTAVKNCAENEKSFFDDGEIEALDKMAETFREMVATPTSE